MTHHQPSETQRLIGMKVDAAYRTGLLVVVVVMMSIVGYVGAGAIISSKGGASDAMSVNTRENV